MRPIALATVLLAVGVAVVGYALTETSQDTDYVERNGANVPGEIVAVAGNDIAIEFSLSQERLRAMAHPSDGADFAVGDFVMILVLRDDPTRIVIQGTRESPPLAATALLLLGALVFLTGIGMILTKAVSTPVAGRFPPFSWTRERHGGA